MADSKPVELSNVNMWEGFYNIAKESIFLWFKQLISYVMEPDSALAWITEIASSCTSLILSVVTLFKQESSVTMRCLSGANLLAMSHNLLIKISSITADFKSGLAFEAIKTYIDTNINDETDRIYANTDSGLSNEWLKGISFALSALFTSIIAGFGFCTKGLDGITSLFRSINFTNSGFDTIKGGVDKVLASIVNEKYDPIYLERKALLDLTEKAQTLVRLPLGEIATSNKSRDNFRTTILDINSALALYKHPETSGLRSVLIALVKDMNKKYEEVEHTSDLRQVTTGLFIQGKRGLGKSSLVSYITKQLAPEFDWSDRIYNVSTGIRFHEPYLLEDFGVCNEFCSTMEKDNFLMEANKICSSDPHNLESASLSGKIASCQLKLLYVTSNIAVADLPELRSHAVNAFWDRFIIVEVLDPKVTGRRKLVAHRKADFSHLRFNIKEVTDSDDDLPRFTTLFENVCIYDILELIKTKLCYEIKKFHELKGIELNSHNQMLIAKYLPPKLGTVSYKYFGLEEVIEVNAAGRDFMVVRLQGKEGTGKTTMARELASKWCRLTTDMEGKATFGITEITNIRQFKPIKKPMIYILDDFVSSNLSYIESHKFVECMNATHVNSIFILTSNEVLTSLSFSQDKCRRMLALLQAAYYVRPYDLSAYDHMYPGISRRIGCDHDYYSHGVVSKSASTAHSLVVDFVDGKTPQIGNLNYTIHSIFDIMVNKYIKYKENAFEITVIHEKPIEELAEVDFELIANNKADLLNKLRSRISITRMYMQPDNEASLIVSDRVLDNLGEKRKKYVNPSDFICSEVFSDELEPEEKYVAVAQKLSVVLLKYFDKPSFRIYIRESRQTAYYSNGILYYYYDLPQEVISFKAECLYINVKTPRAINALDLARSLVEDQPEEKFKGTLHNISMYEYGIIREFYEKAIQRGNINNYITEVSKHVVLLKQRRDPSVLTAMMSARSNKLLMLAISGVVGISTLGVACALFRLFKKNSESMQSNAFANVGSTPPERYSRNLNKQDSLIEQRITEQEVIKHANSPYPVKHLSKQVYTNSPYLVKQQGINKLYSNNLGIEITNGPGENSLVKRDSKHKPHEHVCIKCGCLYSHIHKFNPQYTHTQYTGQCPNKGCEYYHQGDNPKQALLIQEHYEQTEFDLFTPNSLSKAMGPEFEIVVESLRRFFVTLPQEQRFDLYDQIKQCKFEGDRAFKKLTERYPELRECVEIAMHANMLTDADMIEADESELEIIHRKLNRSYVGLTKDLYKSYALHIQDGFFLSVAHCFHTVEEQLILSSAGNRYAAIVVEILRERDIAIIRCDLLKNLPKTIKYFTDNTEELPLYAHFLRCGPQLNVVTGGLEYKEYQEFVGKVCDNEYYKPTMEILKIRRTGLRILDVVNKGDCGFPFIGKIRGSLRILGIHNAYINESVIFGSFISCQLVKELVSKAHPNAYVLSTPVILKLPIINQNFEHTTIEMSMPIEYADTFDRSIKPDPRMPVDSKLKSIGYHSLFANPGKLKEKHKTHDIELQTPNLQLPAAFSNSYIEDYSNIVKNGFGRYDPLLTQAFKYGFKKTEIDEDAFSHAVEMVLDYNKLTYCDEGPLRCLTEYEAINGMRQPFLANFDITTSAGPYAKYFGNVYTKREIFDITMHNGTPEYSFTNSPIAQGIRNNMKQQKKLLYHKHIPPCLISQDNAKVENIDAVKAKQGKVRLFNNVDPSINAILKMLFGHWFAKTMTKSAEAYYAIGQNPYTTSTEIYHRFSSKQGKILNTDFKAFDKTLHPRFIEAFCYIASHLVKMKKGYDSRRIFSSIAKTLIHAVHLLDGSIYIVNNGNESGTFVTTLLNCVSAHLIFCYTFIKCWHRMPAFINITPTLRDVMKYSELGILGDDCTRKISYAIDIEECDLFYFAAELGTECTQAKASEGQEEIIDFCSRLLVWNCKDQIVYPRLKQSSINGLLYWFTSFNINQVRNNLMVCLFEAAMYEREYYEQILSDAIIVSQHFGLDIRTVPFTNYEMARKRLKSMLMNDCEYQDLTALANRNQNFEYDIHDLTNILKQNLLYSASIERADQDKVETIAKQHKLTHTLNKVKDKYWPEGLNEDKMVLDSADNNPISGCLELISKLKTDKPTEEYGSEGPSNTPTHTCTITYDRKKFGGTGPSKASAKNQAYGALRQYLKDNIIVNAACEDASKKAFEAIKKVAVRGFSFLIEHHISAASANSFGRPIIVLVSKRPPSGDVEEIHGYMRFFHDGLCYFLSPVIQQLGRSQSGPCYQRYPGVTINADKEVVYDQRKHQERYTLRYEEERCRYDDDDQLIMVNAEKTTGTLGGVLNDIPPNSAANILLDSENSLHMPIVMNQSGPSNSLLNAGGVNFNITDLVYGQFVASDQFVNVDDTKVRGKVLAIIPYDPINNKYTNDYIQNYCLQHERCVGSWLLCVSCAGNKSMIGSIGICWLPTLFSGTDITMAEATKYSFFTTSVSEPFSYTIAMTDARQSDFYRTLVKDAAGTKSMTDTPSIVIFVQTQSQPVFTEKRGTQLNFFTKLASEMDAKMNPSVKPFIVSNPMLSIKHKSDSDRSFILNF